MAHIRAPRWFAPNNVRPLRPGVTGRRGGRVPWALPFLERLEDRIAPAVITPFTPIFSQNATGDIAIVGNTLETASTVNNAGRTPADVANAQNGVGANVNNNNWNMAYVDVDNNPTTFNSSQSALNLPAGATVLFAGLYWGSVTTTPAQAAARNTVKFSTPGSGGYVSLTGTTIGSTTFTGVPPGTIYESFANVTSQVQAAGNGTYEVANVQAALTDANGNLPYMGSYAGWSLVVAYSAPGAPARNLTVFNGFAVQASTDPALNIPISGFIAPPSGPVNAKVGVVAYEGDLGTTGDSMALNGKQLSDAVTPANNFFNAGISNLGVLQTAKNPNFVNQMGFDAKVVNAPSGAILNSATSATITLTTSGDGYFPGVVTTAIDLFAPNLVATKTVADLSGGNSLPGDTLEYTVNVSNTGQDAAGNVILTDPIPANTVYVPGSLRIVSGANAGILTDAAGDDQAFFDAAHNQVVFDLGAGATALLGGTLGIGAATAIRFRVEVDPGVPANTVVTNQATINYQGVTTGFPFTSLSTVPAFTIANSVADVALAKTVSNPAPNVGDNVTFIVTATDNGPGPATGVTISDLLPPGLQLVNAITSQGAYDGGTGLWTVGSLANGGVATLTIIATVTSPNPQTNTATISHTDSVDPNASNNQASATETPQLADLAIAKSVSNPTPNVGDTITYTVTLTNNGPNNATDVTVTDLLPAGLTFVSSSAGLAYDSTTGLWTVGALANGGSAMLTITAMVASPQAALNAAMVSHADQFDPNTGNNSASALETPQQADLAVSKTVDNPTPNVGAVITYTITLTDNGPNGASGITVQDNLPAGVTFLSSNASQGSYDPNTGLWTVGAIDILTIGTPRVLTITVQVTSVNVAPNTASIQHADQFDPNLANNSATSPVNAQQADLSLSKTVDDPRPNVGEVVTFTLTVRDKGPSTATDVVATDLLPAGLTFVSDTPSQGNYDSTTGVWTVGTVGTTTPQTLLIQARVVSPDPQTNTASVTADQSDPNPNNNTDNAVVTPQQADLAVTKTVDNPTPNVGDTVTFTVTLADNGPDPATNVTLFDLLPAGLSLLGATPSQGTYDSGSGVWTVGTVDPAVAEQLILTALVVSPNAQTNTATVSHSDQFDPDPTNNQGSATETPQQADLALVKTINRLQPNVGDTIVFTVTLTNNGPNIATDVQVNDPLPSGLAFVSAIPSLGTYDSTTGLWTVGTVSPGAPQTLQLEATIISPNPQLNTATISHSDQFDPNPGNNSASATATPLVADLQVSKTVSNPTPNVGDVITYTITLKDNGPDPATTVTVNDQLPAGVSFVSADPSEGTYDNTTGVWTVGTVNPGDPQTLTIMALVVSPNPEANTASVGHSDVFDPNPANNSNSASVNPQEADLALSKTVDVATPNVGDTITYTLTLTDTGPSDATNVAVTDPLPGGLTFVSDTPSQGNYDSTTGVWTVGTVTTLTPQTLLIQARVVSPGAATNTATISHADQFDPDPANDAASATVTPQQADLALAKVVSNPTPNVGDLITFTVTLNNFGPNVATGVLIDDQLPAGLTLVSSAPSQGSYDSTPAVWDAGTVDTAGPAFLRLTARVVGTGAELNTATVGHSDQFDPDPGNNSASALATPQQADLVVSKAASDPTPALNEIITYTARVFNAGPDDATNVQLTDTFPAGVMVLSGSTPNGTYNNGVWDVGTVANGTFATLTITAQVTAAGVQTNSITVSHSDQFDPNLANNTGTTSIQPQSADVAIGKSVNDPTPNVGDTVTFTLTVFNTGPDNATAVSVSDPLPAGLGFVSADQPTYDPTTGTWTVGTVAAGGTAVLHVQAVVMTAGTFNNVATVSNPNQFDPDPGNNTDSSVGVDATGRPGGHQDRGRRLATTSATSSTSLSRWTTPARTRPRASPYRTCCRPELTFVSATPSEEATTRSAAPGPWASSIPRSALNALAITARSDRRAAALDQHGHHHPRRPVRPGPGQQQQPARTTTPQQADLALDQDGQQHRTQRRRQRHLHRHADERRPGPGHWRRRQRPAPGRT